MNDPNLDMIKRIDRVQAAHRRMQEEYNSLRDAGVEFDTDNPSPVWQEWFERFTETKNQMYQLAYELDIPFQNGGEATADHYAQVWNEVQSRLGPDGNRRTGKVRR